MTLTLADIDVWDDAAIDEVFAAATARAEGAQATGDTAGDLLSFVPWDGRAADAARDSAHRIKLTLGDHGDRCRRVAEAARRAAAEVADLKYRLSQIRADADEAFIRIDNQTGALAPRTAVLAVDQLRRREAVMPQLAGRIERLLADADSADRDLAQAIGTAIEYADGDPVGAPRTLPSPLPREGPPNEPADVKKWWDALTPQQQVDYIARDPAAIDRDGIPADIRDAANRIRLPHEIATATTTLEVATRQEAAYWEYVNTHHGELPPDCAADPVAALARARARHDELLGIRKAISGTDRRRLVLLDTKSNPRHVLAAIGVGDVDRAARVGVTTGGVTTDVTDLPRLVEEATELQGHHRRHPGPRGKPASGIGGHDRVGGLRAAHEFGGSSGCWATAWPARPRRISTASSTGWPSAARTRARKSPRSDTPTGRWSPAWPCSKAAR